MESSFLERATLCIKEYERPGVRVQAMAELAPGMIAVFLMREAYCFVIFFDRALHKPSFELIYGLWGENIVYPKPWESRGVGFLPTGHEWSWANFKYLLPFAKKYFPQTISWHEQPVKIVPPLGSEIGSMPGPEWRKLYPQQRGPDGRFC